MDKPNIVYSDDQLSVTVNGVLYTFKTAEDLKNFINCVKKNKDPDLCMNENNGIKIKEEAEEETEEETEEENNQKSKFTSTRPKG